MVTIRQLRYFDALAATLHFGRAARELNISQPALSAQIAQMEALFGTPLFERRSSGVLLTPDGSLLRARARRILDEVAGLDDLVTSRQALLAGRLRLGIIASLAPYLLPGLLKRLAADYPDLDIGVRENVTATLVEDLTRGELDCVVMALPVEQSGLTSIRLAEDPFLLAVPHDRAPHIRTPVTPPQLEGERLILLVEGHCLRDQALDICRIAEARDLASLGATSLGTLMRMVAGGLGVTLAPQSALATERRTGGIAFLPFAEPAPSRTLALVHRASSSRGTDFAALAEILRDCLEADAQPPKPG